jgi:hypothetical protein
MGRWDLTKMRDANHSLRFAATCRRNATETRTTPEDCPATPIPTEPLPQRRAGHSLLTNKSLKKYESRDASVGGGGQG